MLIVSETKIDSSFPNSQFCLTSYRMFKHDRDSFQGGPCKYVNEIPVKQLNLHKGDGETLFSKNKPSFEKIADSRCRLTCRPKQIYNFRKFI